MDNRLAQFNRGPFAPCPAPFNLATYVLGQAARLGDKPALEILSENGAELWTYAALDAAVRGLGTGLLRHGLHPGDRLLLRLGNSADFPLIYLAAILVGIVPVPTSPALTEPEVSAISHHILPAAAVVQEGLPCPQEVLQIPAAQTQAWHRLPPAQADLGDPDRLAYIVFTSGTSGQPRAVAHAHRAIWARKMMHDGWYALRSTDRMMHAGAFNWTFTLGTGLLDPWTLGATALIPAPGTPARDLPTLLQRHHATLFAAAPGIYRQILKAGIPLDLPDLRHGLTAGETLPADRRAQFQKLSGRDVFEAYGMSECSTFLSAAPWSPADIGALGTVQKGRHIALLGETGPVAIGEIGEIAVHVSDPGLMLGYLRQDGTLEKPWGDTPWFRTGDLAVAAPHGQITSHGRHDDMMNAGGFRVSPAEVEACLSACPGVDAVAVTEVMVRPGVTVIAAFFVGGVDTRAETLEAHSVANLARYKQPRVFRRVDALPVGPNGKLSRRRLRDSFRPDSAAQT